MKTNATLNPLFVDGIIFQANKPVRIFGESAKDVQVRIKGLGDTFDKLCPSENGKWLAELPAMPYGGPYEVIVTLDGEEHILKDVMLGDVFIVAGQSNVQFKLRESEDTAVYEDDCLVRLFSTENIEHTDFYHPADGWVKCERSMAGNWSDVAYFVGNMWRQKTGNATGIITSYQGASVIESWMSAEALADPMFDIPLNEKLIDHYYETYTWNKNSALYGFVTEKLVPFSIGNVIWYQGESDSYGRETKIYHYELKAMIECWRKAFRQDLPFTVVQLADYDDRKDEAWKTIQEAQIKITSMLPGVKTVISRDVCRTDNIHPASKMKLSERIAEAIDE